MLPEQHHEGPNVLNPATTTMIGDQVTCMVVGHFSRNCWAALPAAKGKYFASWEQGLESMACCCLQVICLGDTCCNSQDNVYPKVP